MWGPAARSLTKQQSCLSLSKKVSLSWEWYFWEVVVGPIRVPYTFEHERLSSVTVDFFRRVLPIPLRLLGFGHFSPR